MAGGQYHPCTWDRTLQSERHPFSLTQGNCFYQRNREILKIKIELILTLKNKRISQQSLVAGWGRMEVTAGVTHLVCKRKQ